jgi:hypothetical protein
MGACTMMMLPGLGPMTGLLMATYVDVAGPGITFAAREVLIAAASIGLALSTSGSHRDASAAQVSVVAFAPFAD